MLVTATTSVFAVSANDITYKVISLVPNNQTLGVIVDDKLYSLEKVDKSSSLLHYGKAPVAESGYKYAIIQKDDKQVIHMENFTRSTSQEDTLNEYFGRSWNTFPNITKIPNILPPLPIINRIDTNLHIEGQIPTIHLIGNQTAIDYMHNNQLEEFKVDLSMAYIRYLQFNPFTINLSLTIPLIILAQMIPKLLKMSLFLLEVTVTEECPSYRTRLNSTRRTIFTDTEDSS